MQPKFRVEIAMMASKYRTDRWYNRYAHRDRLLKVRRQGNSHESVQRFVDHVTDLIVELEELPSERSTFEWIMEEFEHWKPIEFEMRAIDKADIGHPSRSFDYVRKLIEDELANHDNKRNLKDLE